MIIAGLQKTTLIDYPGKIACTLFLHGCNFRCSFCYNPELVIHKAARGFSEQDILQFLESRRGKLDGVCITGGEPLLSLNIAFLEKIKAMGFLVKLDTNGSFPDRLKILLDKGLIDYVAMDVKTFPEQYHRLIGVSLDLSLLERSMKLLHNFGSYELRTTVVPSFHNLENISLLGSWIFRVLGEKPSILYLQGFKPQEKMIGQHLKKEKPTLEKELLVMREGLLPYVHDVRIRV